MHYYAFSFTNKVLPLPNQYDTLMDWFKRQYPRVELEYHFEVGKRKILHIHGMCVSDRRIYKNRLIKQLDPEEWNFDFDICKNQQAWLAYTTKDKQKEQQILKEWKQKEQEFYSQSEHVSSESMDSMSEEYIEEYIENAKVLGKIIFTS